MQLPGANLFGSTLDLLESDSDFILEIFEGKSMFEFWLIFKSSLTSNIIAKSHITKTITLKSYLWKRTT